MICRSEGPPRSGVRKCQDQNQRAVSSIRRNCGMQVRTSAELALWRSPWASAPPWQQQTPHTPIQAIPGPRSLRPGHGQRRETPTRRPRRRPGRVNLAPIRRAAGRVAIQAPVVRGRVPKPRILGRRSVPALPRRPRERLKPTKSRTPRTAVLRIHPRIQPGGRGIALRPPIPSRRLVGPAKVLRQMPPGPQRNLEGPQPAGRLPRG